MDVCGRRFDYPDVCGPLYREKRRKISEFERGPKTSNSSLWVRYHGGETAVVGAALMELYDLRAWGANGEL